MASLILPNRPKPQAHGRAKRLAIPPSKSYNSSTSTSPFPLLALPPELRALIYTSMLAHPPRWDIRHTGSCPYRDRCGSYEAVPWAQHSSSFSGPAGSFVDSHDRPVCPCAILPRRTHLPFLLTNRQINREATPIFYQTNQLCFGLPALGGGSMTQYHLCQIVYMRPLIRDSVRHLSIRDWAAAPVEPVVDDVHGWTSGGSGSGRSSGRVLLTGGNRLGGEAWSAILACKGLQTLEVHPDNICAENKGVIGAVFGLGSFTRLTAVVMVPGVQVGAGAMFQFCEVKRVVDIQSGSSGERLDGFRNGFWRAAEGWMRALGGWQRGQVWGQEQVMVSRGTTKMLEMERDYIIRGEDGVEQAVRLYGVPNTDVVARGLRVEDNERADRLKAERQERLRQAEVKKEESSVQMREREQRRRDERRRKLDKQEKTDRIIRNKAKVADEPVQKGKQARKGRK